MFEELLSRQSSVRSLMSTPNLDHREGSRHRTSRDNAALDTPQSMHSSHRHRSCRSVAGLPKRTDNGSRRRNNKKKAPLQRSKSSCSLMLFPSTWDDSPKETFWGSTTATTAANTSAGAGYDDDSDDDSISIAHRKLTLTRNDLESLLSDKEFRKLKEELRHSGAVTNGLCKQVVNVYAKRQFARPRSSLMRNECLLGGGLDDESEEDDEMLGIVLDTTTNKEQLGSLDSTELFMDDELEEQSFY